MACSKVTFTFILTTWKVKFILFYFFEIASSHQKVSGLCPLILLTKEEKMKTIME